MRDRATTVFIATSSVVIAFCIVGAGISIEKEGFGANGAAWVQAAGSIAAIAGAVWLFHRERILQRRERRAKGEENAWAVRFALTNAQRDAALTVAEIVDERAIENEIPLRHWLIRSENSQNVLRLFAERADHIHPAINQLASNGLLLLQQMDPYLREAAKFLEKGERPSLAVATDIAQYERSLMHLIEELDARMRGVLKALDTNNDMLPVRGFGVWDMPK